MQPELNYSKLDALCLSVKDRLKTMRYVEVAPHLVRDALRVTAWHLWYGDPSEQMAKAREVLKGYGLDFHLFNCAQTVIFRRYGH